MAREFEREIHLEGFRKVNKYMDGSVIAFEEGDGLAWTIDPDGPCEVWGGGCGTLALGAEEVFLFTPPELLEAAGIESAE